MVKRDEQKTATLVRNYRAVELEFMVAAGTEVPTQNQLDQLRHLGYRETVASKRHATALITWRRRMHQARSRRDGESRCDGQLSLAFEGDHAA
jgi:hypothetical protein